MITTSSLDRQCSTKCIAGELDPFLVWIIGTLSKPRRQRQRERHKTKGLMSKTIAVHVRYNPLYIS